MASVWSSAGPVLAVVNTPGDHCIARRGIVPHVLHRPENQREHVLGRLSKRIFTDRLFTRINEKLVVPRADATDQAVASTDQAVALCRVRLDGLEPALRAVANTASDLAARLADEQQDLACRLQQLEEMVGELTRRLADSNAQARARQHEMIGLREIILSRGTDPGGD